jgi:hypothetical protein
LPIRCVHTGNGIELVALDRVEGWLGHIGEAQEILGGRIVRPKRELDCRCDLRSRVFTHGSRVSVSRKDGPPSD